MSGAALVGALRVMLGLESAGFTEGLTAAQVRLKAFDTKMKGIGAGFTKAGQAMSGVGRDIAAAIRTQINAADAMEEMSQRTGVSVEALSRLDYAASQSGVGVDLLETSLIQLSKKMADAGRGGKSAELFDELGIAVTDASGKMRATEEVMADVADVLSRMPPGANRTAMAVRLLGKSGAGMLPMLQDGAAGLANMAAEAEKAGLVISTGTAAAAGKFNENLDRLQAQVRGVAMIIAANLAPALEAMSAWLVDAAAAFQSLSPVTQKWMTGLAGLAVVGGPVLIGIGALVGSLGTLATAFRVITLAVLGNPIVAVIAAIAAGALVIYQNWDFLSGAFAKMWAGIKENAAAAWQGIKDAWNGAIAFFTKLGTDIADSAMAGWKQMATDINGVWTTIKTEASEAWDEVKSTISGALDAAIAKVKDLLKWFTDAWESVKGIGEAIANALTGGDTLNAQMEKDNKRWVEFGRQNAAGLITGMGEGMAERKAELEAYLDAPVAAAREAYQVRSPSRVFAQIGRFIMQGLGLGIEQGTAGVVSAMATAGKDVADAGRASFSVGSIFGGMTESVDGLGAASDGVFDRMGRWMVDLAKGATTLADTLRRVASSWSSSIGKTVMADISTALTGSMGSAGGGLLAGIIGGLMGFANGGQFDVGGVGGIDSQIVAFRASPNETVSITKPGQGFAATGGGIAMRASELTLTDDGRIMAVVRAEIMQGAKTAASAGAALARADFPDIRRRAKAQF